MKKRRTLDASTARKYAVEAEVDPSTIMKALNSEPIRGSAGHRARRVLIAAGLLPKEAA